MSARSNGSPLWEIRWSDRPQDSALFVGSIEEMGKEIDRRHRETGRLHVAREIDGSFREDAKDRGCSGPTEGANRRRQ